MSIVHSDNFTERVLITRERDVKENMSFLVLCVVAMAISREFATEHASAQPTG